MSRWVKNKQTKKLKTKNNSLEIFAVSVHSIQKSPSIGFGGIVLLSHFHLWALVFLERRHFLFGVTLLSHILGNISTTLHLTNIKHDANEARRSFIWIKFYSARGMLTYISAIPVARVHLVTWRGAQDVLDHAHPEASAFWARWKHRIGITIPVETLAGSPLHHDRLRHWMIWMKSLPSNIWAWHTQ